MQSIFFSFDSHDINKILLKVALNTITPHFCSLSLCRKLYFAHQYNFSQNLKVKKIPLQMTLGKKENCRTGRLCDKTNTCTVGLSLLQIKYPQGAEIDRGAKNIYIIQMYILYIVEYDNCFLHSRPYVKKNNIRTLRIHTKKLSL